MKSTAAIDFCSRVTVQLVRHVTVARRTDHSRCQSLRQGQSHFRQSPCGPEERSRAPLAACRESPLRGTSSMAGSFLGTQMRATCRRFREEDRATELFLTALRQGRYEHWSRRRSGFGERSVRGDQSPARTRARKLVRWCLILSRRETHSVPGVNPARSLRVFRFPLRRHHLFLERASVCLPRRPSVSIVTGVPRDDELCDDAIELRSDKVFQAQKVVS